MSAQKPHGWTAGAAGSSSRWSTGADADARARSLQRAVSVGSVGAPQRSNPRVTDKRTGTAVAASAASTAFNSTDDRSSGSTSRRDPWAGYSSGQVIDLTSDAEDHPSRPSVDLELRRAGPRGVADSGVIIPQRGLKFSPARPPSHESSSTSRAVPNIKSSKEMPSGNIQIYNERRRQLQDAFHQQTGPVKEILNKYITEMKKDHVYIAKNALAAARLDMNSWPVFRGKDREDPAERGREGILYDEESPFKDMHSIALDISVADAAKRTDLGKFTAKNIIKQHTTSHEHRMFVPAKIAETPKDLLSVPKYHSYTTLRNNVLAEDDEVMRYHPYFGENAEDDDLRQLALDETFIDRTKIVDIDGKNNELASMYSNFIHDFLRECNLSEAAVTRYLTGDISNLHNSAHRAHNEKLRREALPPDFDLEDPKWKTVNGELEEVSIDELERCEPVCTAFKEVTGMSIWEVVKKTSQVVKDSIAPSRLTTGGGTQSSQGNTGRNSESEKATATLTGGNLAPYSLESYTSLCCLICFMHECPFHVSYNAIVETKHKFYFSLDELELQADVSYIDSPSSLKTVQKDQDRLAMSAADDSTTDAREPSRRKDNSVIMRLATSLPGWSYSSKGAAKDPWEGVQKACSKYCILTIGKGKRVVSNEWTPAQEALLKTSASVLRNNPRCSCLIASIINRPCAEIYHHLEKSGLLHEPVRVPNPAPFDPMDLANAEARNLNYKRKKTSVPALPGYPANCDRTHVHDKRQSFQACRHLGECTDSCPCVALHVTCEKSCTCSPSCSRRWRGCSCSQQSKPCSKESLCACLKANRECDPDLCGQCGAAEALDPVYRYDELIYKTRCQNIAIQRDMPVRTLLGRSSVAGFGLFAGENVEKDSFLGEYKGEIISTEEAERRGKLYDKRGVSFLFNLNATQVIDATRAGNKFRYVNHSSKNPNMGARIVMAGCTHRIAMFATRDVKEGEELFFNYGLKYTNLSWTFIVHNELVWIDDAARYNNKQVKFVQKEAPVLFSAESSINGDAEPRPHRPRKHRVKNLEYLKGGKGTTERTMKMKTRVPTAVKSVGGGSSTHAVSLDNADANSSSQAVPKRRGPGRPRKQRPQQPRKTVPDADASSAVSEGTEQFVVDDYDLDEDVEEEYRPDDDEEDDDEEDSESSLSSESPEEEIEEVVRAPVKRRPGRPPKAATKVKRRRLGFSRKTAG